jgi:hypothetical protein
MPLAHARGVQNDTMAVLDNRARVFGVTNCGLLTLEHFRSSRQVIPNRYFVGILFLDE